jgi:protein BUR2
MASNNPSQHPPRRPVPAPSNDVLLDSQKQWYFTDEELTRTPSLLDGMSAETEHVQRSKGVNFIVQVGIMLKLPQLTLTTAAVFLHRFFVRYSMVDLPRRPGMHPYSVAAGCLFLASKVDENSRKIKEFVIACCRVAQKNNNLEVDEQNKEFWRWKDTLVAYEDMCLEALCFDLQLEQPHKICYDFLCYFGKNDHKALRNAAWAFLNDSNYTILCLQFYPRTIAAAALWAGARLCNVAFEDDEEGRPWWEQLDVNLSEVRRAVSRMVQLYERNITVHRQAHEYPNIPTDDGDNSPESTRIINPNPHSISESMSSAELNGRKRSREAEAEDIHQHHLSPRKLSSSYETNHTRERSPKRQRLTPDPSHSPRSSSGAQRPPTTNGHNHHHYQTPRAANSRIPSAAMDDAHRRQHTLPPPPGPVDAVQQRIDEIVQQGLARNDKLGPTPSRSESYHHSSRHRERDNRDRYRDHDRYDRDRDRDRGRDWRRSDSFEGGGGEHRDRDSNNKDWAQRRPSTESSAQPPQPTSRPPNAPSSASPSSSRQKGEREREDKDNEEGEITDDREEGEVTTRDDRRSSVNNTINDDHDEENKVGAEDNNGDDDGGGSEEGEV